MVAKAIFLIALFSLCLSASLSKKDLTELKFRISLLESKGLGDTRAENSYGYLGRYQFGAVALVEVGLMKHKKYIQHTHIDPRTKKLIWNKGYSNKKFINDKNNWNLSEGKESFLGNETLQEKVMDSLLEKNYLALKKTGIKVYQKEKMMGFLMAAHLGGFKSALHYLKSKKEYKDGFGTKISTYFNAAKKKIQMDTKQSDEIVALGKKYLGGKYVWGGTNPSGFDCSGYVKYIFGKQGIKLPRTAYSQSKTGQKVSLSHIKKGDLLFFNTDPSRGIPVTHVGVYLENGKFIHAANKKEGITISALESYKKRFVVAKRVLKSRLLGKNIKHIAKTSNIVPQNFFRTHLEQAIKAPTKVTLNTNAFKYKYINGGYVQVGGIMGEHEPYIEEEQLW